MKESIEAQFAILRQLDAKLIERIQNCEDVARRDGMMDSVYELRVIWNELERAVEANAE